MVWATQGDQALHPSISTMMLYIMASDDAPLGVADDVEPLQASACANALEFVCDRSRKIWNRVGVEPPEQSTEIKAEDTVALSPKALLHDLPDIPRLEEAVQKKDRFLVIRKVVSTHDPVPPQVHAADAAELVSEHAHERRWLGQRILHP